MRLFDGQALLDSCHIYWSWDKISAALGGTPNGETLRRNFGGEKETAS